jgi:hypothetical protein
VAIADAAGAYWAIIRIAPLTFSTTLPSETFEAGADSGSASTVDVAVAPFPATMPPEFAVLWLVGPWYE